jgi:DNA-binding transcriptional regulator LsrR (DeoR family)
MAEMLRSDNSIAEALDMASSVEVALFGIGDLGPETTIPIASALTESEWSDIEEAGAVGAVCVRFFDHDGRIAVPQIDARTIGLTLDQLVAIPTKIGVAGGVRKLAATLGALRGRLLDVLITDESLAEALFVETIRADTRVCLSIEKVPTQ